MNLVTSLCRRFVFGFIENLTFHRPSPESNTLATVPFPARSGEAALPVVHCGAGAQACALRRGAARSAPAMAAGPRRRSAFLAQPYRRRPCSSAHRASAAPAPGRACASRLRRKRRAGRAARPPCPSPPAPPGSRTRGAQGQHGGAQGTWFFFRER